MAENVYVVCALFVFVANIKQLHFFFSFSNSRVDSSQSSESMVNTADSTSVGGRFAGLYSVDNDYCRCFFLCGIPKHPQPHPQQHHNHHQHNHNNHQHPTRPPRQPTHPRRPANTQTQPPTRLWQQGMAKEMRSPENMEIWRSGKNFSQAFNWQELQDLDLF